MGTNQRWCHHGGPGLVGMDVELQLCRSHTVTVVTAASHTGWEVKMRNSKTGQECNAAESGAGRLGGAGKTDSFLSPSLFMWPSPCVCICLSHVSSHFSLILYFLYLSVCLPFSFSSFSLSLFTLWGLAWNLIVLSAASRCLPGRSAMQSIRPPFLFLSDASGGLYWHSIVYLFRCVAFTVWFSLRTLKLRE